MGGLPAFLRRLYCKKQRWPRKLAVDSADGQMDPIAGRPKQAEWYGQDDRLCSSLRRFLLVVKPSALP